MTSEIEEQVNIAIEFFPGRVKRDEWTNQYFLLSGIFSGFHLYFPSLWRLFALYCLFSTVISSLKIGI
jgi:hypothetical protein